MRQSAEWMQLIDDRILEIVAEFEPATSGLIHQKLRLTVSSKQVQERCRILANAGLLEPFIDSKQADMWEMSIWGSLYLEGELNADLRRPQPRPQSPRVIGAQHWLDSPD